MQQILDMILGGGIGLSLFDADLLALDQELPKSDVFALLMLQRRGQATMSELAADLGAPLSTATGIGSRLVRRGLVERHRDPDDRRVIVVRLTPEGAELAARVQEGITDIIGRITAALTAEELQQLMHLVQKVLGALKPKPAPADQPEEPKTLRRISIDDEE